MLYFYMCSKEYDSVAQLGERYLDRVEVAGSSPVGIIHFKIVLAIRTIFSFLERGFSLICFCEKQTTNVYIEGDFADPLWCSHCFANLEICEVASIELARQFHAWNQTYGAWYNFETDTFTSEAKALIDAFNREGQRLTNLLQQEVGSSLTIDYRSITLAI